MFLLNSRSASFTASRYLAVREGHLANLRPAILPSSLRIVLPIAFVYSTRPPVSVYSTAKTFPFANLFLKTENCLPLQSKGKLSLTYVFVTHIIVIDCKSPICIGEVINCSFRNGADFPTPTSLILKPRIAGLDYSHSVHPQSFLSKSFSI